MVPSGGKLRAGNVRAPPLPFCWLPFVLLLLLADAVDAADEDEDADAEAELSEAESAALPDGLGRPGNVPMLPGPAARFASAIVLLAAEISAFSSTRTVQGLLVGYDILNTLDAVNSNVITSITHNNTTSIAVHFHVHLVKLKPLRKFSGAE